MELQRYPRQLSQGAQELQELHAAGFMHYDLLRPSSISGDRYDNIRLSPQGLWLIDVDISVLRHQVGDKFFAAYVQREQEELELFRHFLLMRQEAIYLLIRRPPVTLYLLIEHNRMLRTQISISHEFSSAD